MRLAIWCPDIELHVKTRVRRVGIELTDKVFKMSFAEIKSVVEEGDTVVIYVNPQAMYAIQVKPLIASKKGDMVENVFQTAYGALKVQELVGKKFGHKVEFSRGWGYLLHPTPELWTLTLPHRTQILYTPDISLIIMQLDLKVGSIVVESGEQMFKY